MNPRRSRALVAVATGLVAGLSTVLVAPSVAAPAGTEHRPDLQTVIPTNAFSVVTGTAGRELRYTHLVYNSGPGPLEIQPSYDAASGGYRGQQLLFTHDANGTWSQVRSVRVPDTFVYHVEHGHFHFPFATFGLYAVAADGGVGAPVALSPKVGFCIDDSYIYDSTVPHAGTFVGTKSSCTDPTGLRGLSVGGADEYDYRDPGQAIPIDGVPDGTYWFRAVSDPNNDFVEANEANNETDVQVTITGGTVTVGQVVHPDSTPPTGTLDVPLESATVSGTVPLTATTAASVAKVDFVVDGNVVGTSTSAGSPYAGSWDSTTVVDGTHWLAARITDTQGRIGTTPVTAVTVANVAPPPPSGTFALDGTASQDGRGTQTTPTLTGLHAGDVLLAFVTCDGPTTSAQSATVSGAGTGWTLVRRANAQAGTSEVWKAVLPSGASSASVTSVPSAAGFDQSVTLAAFAGSAGVGTSAGASAATGAPTVSLTTTKAGSWVFGAGNDWDRAVARTLGTDQVMRHQWVDSGVGDTFWVQSRTGPTASSGTVVPINDTAPTTDRYNLVSVEVVPADSTPPAPDQQAPDVSITDPHDGAVVSGTVAIGVTAADNVGVASVTFTVDGQPLGSPDTAPPFMASWDSKTVAGGQHVLGASAVDAAGNVGTASPITVTVDNSAPPPAPIGVDQKVVRQGRNVLKSPGLTTAAAGEVLVAFVGLDGPKSAGSQTATVTGGGLTWSLVKRANTQAGDAEVWSARAATKLSSAVVTATPGKGGYDGLLTVIAFKNAAGTGVAGAGGAPSGAPSIYLPAVTAGSWVFAVGNDWDRAVARTPVSGQVLQQQWLDGGSGDTFWVQSTTAPSTVSGLVTIADTAPTADQWNYAAVEVTAAPSG